MRFLIRHDDEHRRPNQPGGDAPDDFLTSIRTEGSRLLAAGDAAINKALEGSNSEEFLRAGRQQGGE